MFRIIFKSAKIAGVLVVKTLLEAFKFASEWEKQGGTASIKKDEKD